MVRRALIAGAIGLVISPLFVYFAAMAIGDAIFGCGPAEAEADKCAFGATIFAIAAIAPGFFTLATLSVLRDLLRGRRVGGPK